MRTTVKPLWPTTPKTQKKAKMTQDCKNVTLKLPKISLKNKGYFGQFKGHILCSGNFEGFFASEGGSCHRGFTIVLRFLSRSFRRETWHCSAESARDPCRQMCLNYRTEIRRNLKSEFPLPKGPFRTKNSTALESVLFCHHSSFSVSVPFSCLFSLEKQALLRPLRSILLRPYRICSPYRNSLSVLFLVRKGPLGKCTTASQPQSLAIFWIAGEIARNFRSKKQIWPFFIAKCIATATVSLPQRNRNLFPSKNRCVQFDRVNESQASTANHRQETVHLGLRKR